MGTDQVSEDEILRETGYARTDCKGYRAAIKILTQELEYATRSKKIWALTDKGLEYMKTKVGGMTITPKTNKDHAVWLKQIIIKASKKQVKDKLLDDVWKLLSDGGFHHHEEVLKVAGYSRFDCKGNCLMVKWMKELQIVNKTGQSYQFVMAKVFPYTN